MEGRGTQQDRVNNGQKEQSPNCNSFQTKLLSLTSRAKQIRDEPLRTLMHLVDKEWLGESWRKLRKGAAYGIDAVSSNKYAENLSLNLYKLLYRMQRGKYKAQPVKRVYIAKRDGSKRPLGLPTVEDKVAQNAVNLLLKAVYEPEFLLMSYGFREGKNSLQAVEDVKETIAQKKVSWVLDVDIASFFDNMQHEWLMKFVSHRIKDQRVLKHIKGWLEAGIMEDGKLIASSTGSPQGGVISPTLANIYLHYVIDLWCTKVARNSIKGEMYSFRYADDLLFCFQHENQAVKFQEMLKSRLQKFELEMNLKKSKLCRFGKFAIENSRKQNERRSTFSFLGFTFYNGISRNGKYKVGCRTESKRLSAAMNRVTTWCRENLHQPLPWQARYLNAVLRGHYNYYGVTGNYPSISAFYRHLERIWHKYLSRRSQRGYIPWERFWKIKDQYGLIKPHLPHSVHNN
ncbi:group II intron reverse transcriptase/maturase [Candidatus Trichorickettsia mobilis]|uniref:group II intron reverse transcriptase/maturase n=1 Tax=Candidatus Trichorickettsia mobilis TaxID=1346319 RepID=UPI002B258495|nr:group II intron reverse transcriptase/maturase [Candidatus Trichorickettsia mobilis]